VDEEKEVRAKSLELAISYESLLARYSPKVGTNSLQEGDPPLLESTVELAKVFEKYIQRS
jgi:hypothetical protein